MYRTCLLLLKKCGFIGFLLVSSGIAYSQDHVERSQFFEVMDAFKEAYWQEITGYNQPFELYAMWNNDRVYAGAQRKRDGAMDIIMTGGLARRPGMTKDGLATILCHEVGHLFGGEPYFSNDPTTVEGGADYYAASVCLPRLFEHLPADFFDYHAVPERIVAECTNVSSSYLCQRIISSAESLLRLEAGLQGKPQPTCGAQDCTAVAVTLESYPATFQCRLDTFIAGATGRARPSCWYVETHHESF